MARIITGVYKRVSGKKRPGVHSKNASKGQSGYKEKYRGQGRWEIYVYLYNGLHLVKFV